MPATFSIDLNLNVPKELLTVLQKIAEAIAPKTFTVNQQAQSPAEMAARQRVIPVNNTQMPAPAPKPQQQPVYTQAPAVQPAAPVNNNPPATQPTPQQQAPAATAAASTVPTAPAPSYTLEQLQTAISPLFAQGKGPQLQGLLKKYGVQRLPDIPKEQLGNFATDIRGMGAQI
jgi:hypothetical protein